MRFEIAGGIVVATSFPGRLGAGSAERDLRTDTAYPVTSPRA
jgi:hypothetical protein